MKTILLIDDDPFVTTLYRTCLSNEGYRVETANSGESALEKLNSTIPDLIVLDLNMPGLNGVDVLKQVRTRPDTTDCPVIVLSNGYVQNLIDQAMSLNVTKIFTKAQCPPNKMMAEIKEAVESAPEHRPRPELDTASAAQNPPELNPLAALIAATETTWQTIDLTALPENAPPETKRRALAGLYRSIHQRLDDSLAEKPGSEIALLANELRNMFGNFYGHPEQMTKASTQALLRGIGNLSRMKSSGLPRQSVLDNILRRHYRNQQKNGE
jgi:CheY-like chemotaxis protein